MILIPSWISTVADITGIFSFVLSIVLLWRSETLRQTIIYQRLEYNRTHVATKANLMALCEALQEGDPLSQKTISKLRRLLYDCEFSFRHILYFKDHRLIKRLLKKINKAPNAIDVAEVIRDLDYLISRFDKKEDS